MFNQVSQRKLKKSSLIIIYVISVVRINFLVHNTMLSSIGSILIVMQIYGLSEYRRSNWNARKYIHDQNPWQ